MLLTRLSWSLRYNFVQLCVIHFPNLIIASQVNTNELLVDDAAEDTMEYVEADGSESDVSISSLHTCQMVCFILDSFQENSNQVPVLTGTPYNGMVTDSAGVSTLCTVRDCSVELVPLKVPKFWPVGHKRVKADTSLRLATSRDVALAVSAPVEEAVDRESESEAEMDVTGRSDDSDLDPGYSLPDFQPSDSESDLGEGSQHHH